MPEGHRGSPLQIWMRKLLRPSLFSARKSQLPSQIALDLFDLAALPPSLLEAWEVAPVNFRL